MIETAEMVSFNLDCLDVEELEQRLELQADAPAESPCDCWSNGCETYCTKPAPTAT